MANVDMFAIAVKIFGPVVSGILSFIGSLFGLAILGVVLFFVVFIVRYRIYGEYLTADRLESLEISLRFFALEGLGLSHSAGPVRCI